MTMKQTAPEFSIPNERISKQGRFVFFFSKDKEELCDWTGENAGGLVGMMNKNNEERMLWKNILTLTPNYGNQDKSTPHN